MPSIKELRAKVERTRMDAVGSLARGPGCSPSCPTCAAHLANLDAYVAAVAALTRAEVEAETRAKYGTSMGLTAAEGMG